MLPGEGESRPLPGVEATAAPVGLCTLRPPLAVCSLLTLKLENKGGVSQVEKLRV